MLIGLRESRGYEVMIAESGAWTHRETIVNGIRLHYVEAGAGPLVLLLHGFPEFWYSWRLQIPALAAAGYRVVAPDMRGYNLSEKPPGAPAYHIDHLVADTAALLRIFGGEAGGYLAGHDWGGLVAWHTASRHPELVRRLAILNAPHPSRFVQVLRASRGQKLKSSYVALFQLPWLPELLLTAFRAALVERALRNAIANKAAFTPDDARAYRRAITQPGAATAMLNYYRSRGRRVLLRRMQERPTPITMPTLLIWGVNDPALELANADRDALLRWVPDVQVDLVDAGHFVHLDRPEAVNEKIAAFLT